MDKVDLYTISISALRRILPPFSPLLYCVKSPMPLDIKSGRSFGFLPFKISIEPFIRPESIKLAKLNIKVSGSKISKELGLNYINIDDKFCRYAVDKNPNKIGKYIPGTKIEIIDNKRISKIRPDYIWILPWNLKKEISKQLSYTKKWNCKLLITIPKIQLIK